MKLSYQLILLFVPLISACGASMPYGQVFGGSGTSSSASVDLANASAVESQALNILANNCATCHTASSGPAGIFNLLDTNHLISSGLVVPGNPDASLLLQSIEANRMPAGSPLSASDKLVLRTWIQGGAHAPTTPVAGPPLIPLGPTYKSLNANVLIPKCVGCHNSQVKSGGYDLSTYDQVIRILSPGRPASSKIYQITQSGEMPPRPDPVLNSEELRALSDWITAGAANN